MKWSAVAISFLLAFTWRSPTQIDAAEAPQNRIEVVLLGTGYPRPYPDRAGPSTAVVINGRYFIVDAGRAVVLRLSALQQPMPPITAGFLTPPHSYLTNR